MVLLFAQRPCGSRRSAKRQASPKTLFNLATSRARCACILVGSPSLFSPECRTLRERCRYLSKFLSACKSCCSGYRAVHPAGSAQEPALSGVTTFPTGLPTIRAAGSVAAVRLACATKTLRGFIDRKVGEMARKNAPWIPSIGGLKSNLPSTLQECAITCHPNCEQGNTRRTRQALDDARISMNSEEPKKAR